MSDTRRNPRFHGRVEGAAPHCAAPGCDAPGEFRAPDPSGRRNGFDGPGDWQWLCLDHVREHNQRYNFFSGMSTEEIEAEQRPYAGWERETRAFSPNAGAGPRWADFADPLDAISARFRGGTAGLRPKRPGDAERETLELGPDATWKEVRRRYVTLLRKYHPDHNGGDRSQEKRLQATITAYTRLKDLHEAALRSGGTDGG